MSDAISFPIPPELRRALARLCKRQKRPVSDVAREALRRYIAMGELRSLRERLRPYAEAQGFLTDEDVFNVVS